MTNTSPIEQRSSPNV